jgi:hypothetical protein
VGASTVASRPPAGRPSTGARSDSRRRDVRIPPAVVHEISAKDSAILQVESACVAILSRRRNGWHSTPVLRYHSDNAMFTDVSTAQQAAEPLRTQGTVFHVREVPALVFRSASEALVLLDFHTADSFFSYRPFAAAPVDVKVDSESAPPLFVGITMRDVMLNFADRTYHWESPRPSPHSLLAGRVSHFTPLQVVSHNKRLKLYSSHVAAAGRRLAWWDAPAGRSWRSTHGIARSVQAGLAEMPGYQGALDEAMRLEQDLAAHPWSCATSMLCARSSPLDAVWLPCCAPRPRSRRCAAALRGPGDWREGQPMSGAGTTSSSASPTPGSWRR